MSILTVVAVLIAAGLGVAGGYLLRKNYGVRSAQSLERKLEQKLKQAKEKVAGLREQAEKETRQIREKVEKEMDKRRSQLVELEARIADRENKIEDKITALEKQEGILKQQREKVSEDQYFEMCRLKTGSLMRLSGHFACLLAEQDTETIGLVRQFAEISGIAFQIRDDVLDLTATPEDFGKAYGNDITEGKKSLPVIFALQQLSRGDASRLREILTMHTSDFTLINEAHALVGSTDALQDASARAEQMFREAWRKAENVFTDATGRETLHELGQMFIDRKN